MCAVSAAMTEIVPALKTVTHHTYHTLAQKEHNGRDCAAAFWAHHLCVVYVCTRMHTHRLAHI